MPLYEINQKYYSLNTINKLYYAVVAQVVRSSCFNAGDPRYETTCRILKCHVPGSTAIGLFLLCSGFIHVPADRVDEGNSQSTTHVIEIIPEKCRCSLSPCSGFGLGLGKVLKKSIKGAIKV